MACVATMPTSASAQSTPLPTENTRDWTAPPTSPVAGSYPRIENVPVSHTTDATVPCVVIDPPQVAVFMTVHATHVNEFFGVPGTHRRVEITSSRLMRLESGLITHERRTYDFTGLLVQVGVLRAKPFKPGIGEL